MSSGAFSGDPLDFVKSVGAVVWRVEGFFQKCSVPDVGERAEFEIVLWVDAHFTSHFCEAEQIITSG